MALDLPSSYSRIAAEYARQYYSELDGKPLDRQLLDRLVELTRGLGPVCDMGCGPGEVAHYLKERGADVFGIDLSPGMVAEASRLDPRIPFRVGSMLALEDLDCSWGGIAAFYSIVHVPPELVVSALKEMQRVLAPEGVLLITYHIGTGSFSPETFWEMPINITWYFFLTEDMVSWLKEAGFQVVDVIERWPYPDVEYQGKRGYIFAKKS